MKNAAVSVAGQCMMPARPGDGHWTTTKHNEFLSSHQAGQPGRPLASTEVRRGRGGGGWELRWGEGVFIGFQFSSQQPPAQAAARQWRQQQTPHIRNQSQPVPVWSVPARTSRHRLSCHPPLHQPHIGPLSWAQTRRRATPHLPP